MKKLFSIIIIISLLLSNAAGESFDFSGMSLAELRELRHEINVEIDSRINGEKKKAREIVLNSKEGVILADDGEILVYLTGRKRDLPDLQRFDLEVVFENHSNIEMMVYATNAKLDGWTLPSTSIAGTLKSNEKKRDEFYIRYLEAFKNNAREMNEYQFNLVTMDRDYNLIKDYGIYAITFDPLYWSN